MCHVELALGLLRFVSLSLCIPPIAVQVFEDAVVRRVDPALGLLCSLPPAPGGAALTPGYAHISALDDAKVEDLAKVSWRRCRYSPPQPGIPVCTSEVQEAHVTVTVRE